MKHISAKDLITRQSVLRANDRLAAGVLPTTVRRSASGVWVATKPAAPRPSREQFEAAGRKALELAGSK